MTLKHGQLIGSLQSGDSNRFYGIPSQQVNADGTPVNGSWDIANLPESMRTCPFDGNRVSIVGSQSYRARCCQCGRQFGVALNSLVNDALPFPRGRVFLQKARDGRTYIVLWPT